MSSLESQLMDVISEIIDMGCEYKFMRREIDDDFAKAHGVTVEDIVNKSYTPCLECGSDITARLLLNTKKTKAIVFCSTECRSKNNLFRLTKISEETNIRDLAQATIARCLTIVRAESPADVKKRTSPLVVRKLLAENNRLLELILEELRASRKA